MNTTTSPTPTSARSRSARPGGARWPDPRNRAAARPRARASSSSPSRRPGISYAEQAMRRGRYFGQPKFPFVPGYDLVGTVLQVGPGGGRRARSDSGSRR